MARKVIPVGKKIQRRIVKTPQELIDALGNQINKKFVDKFTKQMENELYNNILYSVYRANTPKNYSRTNDFINSIEVEKSTINKKTIYGNRVFINWKKFRVGTGGPRQWPQHYSVTEKQPFKRGLIDVLNDGDYKGIYKRDGAYFIEDTIEWAQKNIGTEAVYFIRNNIGYSVRMKK